MDKETQGWTRWPDGTRVRHKSRRYEGVIEGCVDAEYLKPEDKRNPDETQYRVRCAAGKVQCACQEDLEIIDAGTLRKTAEELEKRFAISNDLRDLVRASRYWREVGDPARAIRATGVDLPGYESRAVAALLTSRGGAFRDLEDLEQAEACAKRALEYNSNDYHPYNLLGAVCYDWTGRYWPSTRIDEGDRYFAEAKRLGSPPNAKRIKMRATWPAEVKRAIAERLLTHR